MIRYNQDACKRLSERAVKARQTFLHNDQDLKCRDYYDALDNLTNDLSNWEYDFFWLCYDNNEESVKRYIQSFIERIDEIKKRFNLPTMSNGLNAHNPVASIDIDFYFALNNLKKLLS